MLYVDLNKNPVKGTDQFVSSDGTQYPSNWDKSALSELHLVIETERPSEETCVVTGFIIDDTFTQVWQTRDKTEEETKANNIFNATNWLRVSDRVAIRCFKMGVDFPQEWKDYVITLRAIVDSGIGTMPDMPEYPVGT